MKMRFLNNLVRHITPSVGTVIVVALLLIGYRAWAMPAAPNAGPGVISYQGTLTDPTGQLLSGNVDMTFKLYDVSTGGTALWTEVHADANAVPVSNGVFNVLLGSLTPIPSTAWENASLFLEVTVDGEVLAPREPVGSVPHAMYAVHADLAYNLSAPDGDPVHAATVDNDGTVHIEGGGDASLAGGGRLVLGPTSDVNIVMDGNEIMARDGGEDGPQSTLFLQHEGGDLDVGGDIFLNGQRPFVTGSVELSSWSFFLGWYGDTGVAYADYVCLPSGIYASGGDIDEGSDFYLRFFASTNPFDPESETWNVCFSMSLDEAFSSLSAGYFCIHRNLIGP